MNERTNGHSGTTGALGGTFGVEGGGDERRADALALVIFADLGVDEDRPAATADIAGEPDDLAVAERLVPARCLVVLDGDPGCVVGHARHPTSAAVTIDPDSVERP